MGWVLWGAVAAACAPPDPTRPVPLEIWRLGDDGLTLRFADSLREAFAASTVFVKSGGKLPGTLVVTIPHELRWNEKGRRIRATYTVEFTDSVDRRLGSMSGTCWEDDFRSCAQRVVERAKLVAERLLQR